MKDICGVELEVGQTVAYSDQGGASLHRGTIIGFTAKMVKIKTEYSYQEVKNKFPCDLCVSYASERRA